MDDDRPCFIIASINNKTKKVIVLFLVLSPLENVLILKLLFKSPMYTLSKTVCIYFSSSIREAPKKTYIPGVPQHTIGLPIAPSREYALVVLFMCSLLKNTL